MEKKENVIVSLCVFGVVCRYHGKSHKMGHLLYKKKRTDKLKEKYNILPLCGEIMGGLPTPRPPCKVIKEDEIIKVIGKYDNVDYTKQYVKGANEILRLAKIFDVKKAFLLKDSPMCGKDYGILAEILKDNGITVYNI